MFCSECGAEVANDAAYCATCGKGLGVPATVPTTAPSNSMGVASVVLAVAAFALSFWYFGLGLLAGIAAVVVGIIGLGRVKRGRASSRALPWVGIGLGVVLPLLFVVFLSVFFAKG